MFENKKRIFLLDAMALIYRAYYALNKTPRINSKGLNTSAIVGFTNTLYDIIKNEKPTHIAVSFDTKEPTHRHIDFVDYKAHREAAPEDLLIALPYIVRLIEAFNIPVINCDGFEADDVIGTLAKEAEKNGFITYMMTTDKDFGQLVSENIFIYKPGRMGNKSEIIGKKEICEKYGIKRPEQVIDILGLWGDASDNIPGVPGIGEVNACKLIQEYDSIENLFLNNDKLKGKIKENLVNFKDQAIQSKYLATIVTNAPVEFNEEKLLLTPPDEVKLKELLDELEFRTFAKRVFTDLSLQKQELNTQDSSFIQGLFKEDEKKENNINSSVNESFKNVKTEAHNYMLLDSVNGRNELISRIKKNKTFCFDIETTGLDGNNSEIVGIAFSIKPGEAYYLPIHENYNEAHKILNEFKEVFEDARIEKIGQNIKFDMLLLKWYDIEVKGKLFDTMIAHYLLQPDMRHNMDLLAETYLNYQTVHIEELIGKKGKNQLSMRNVDIDVIKEYTCEDADITIQLKNVFEPMIKENKLENIFYNIELPLIPVLTAMEAEGVKIDIPALKSYSIELKKEIDEIEKEIYSLTGMTFNISSPKQMGEVLFDHLKIIEKPKKTATKQYSTSEETLVKLKAKHPVIEKILDYRSLTKLKSTYVDTFPEMINPRTGRLHTSYNQAVAATGRLSSNNPNLQNIPIRTERGREMRKAFICRSDKYILLSADYSQIELRLMAEISGDENMMDAFNKGIDIHTVTASKVFDIPTEEVTPEQRRKAKTVNFGIIYGISAFGLSERINIPRREAADIIQQYFANFNAIQHYMDKTIEFARQNGYVETLLGRRRYINNINSSNGIIRGYAERNAINAPIQGSAADMIKIAMIKIFDDLKSTNLKTKMLLQVHDELVFDVYKDELSLVKEIVRRNMINAIKTNVPIEIEMSVGTNWLDAH